jgi:hypothetical protein
VGVWVGVWVGDAGLVNELILTRQLGSFNEP